MDALFSETAARLAEHHRRGKPGLIAGTRGADTSSKLSMVYEIERETMWILALVHTRSPVAAAAGGGIVEGAVRTDTHKFVFRPGPGGPLTDHGGGPEPRQKTITTALPTDV